MDELAGLTGGAHCSPKVTRGQPRGGCGGSGPGAASVRTWFLDVVDHQHFNLAFDCLQPEPKLFL